jgi:predicted NUDIX family NTP pyrophosphohydrolase
MKNISVLVQHHAGPTGNVLICKNQNGVWEFPNGTVRTNETESEAAARICGEVLGMTVTVGKLIMIGSKTPKDGYVEHIVCGNITHNTHSKFNHHVYYEAVNKWQVEPKSGTYTEFKYVHPSELGQYEFAGDDKNFMAKYDPYINAETIPDVRMP